MEFSDFQPPLFAATVMNAFGRPWCIAGGWAIDLWLGHSTRGHADVEIAILREDQIDLRDFLAGARFDIATSRGRIRWRDRQMLMLPIHELHADYQGHELEILLNEHHRGEWVYRRDWRVKMPIERWMVRAAFGVPVIAPEIALLYKSAHPQSKDLLDLHSAIGALQPEPREWLLDALRLTQPDHPWLSLLGTPA